MKKYEVDRTAYSDGRMPDNDIVLYRYADVLLMKAEAKVRNGETGDEQLNAVRSRAGMPSLAATLANILDERLLELVWEGWRRQDMIRLAPTASRTTSTHRQSPTEAIHHSVPNTGKSPRTEPNLAQNPGY